MTTDRSTTPVREWGEGPDGDKDVVAYIEATPDLFAMFVELHMTGYIEHGDAEVFPGQWETIFTITNHWRERELALSTMQSESTASSEYICPKCGVRHICPTDHERVNW